MNGTKVAIIGAGIGGLTTAVALRRLGVAVEVWERASELRAAGSGLSVGSNAVSALNALDIDLGFDDVRGAYARVVQVVSPEGTVLAEPPLPELGERLGAPIVCIHRGDLQAALLAEMDDVPIHLGAVATGYTYDDDGVHVRFADGRETSATVLVGADGMHSAVRAQIHGVHPTRYGGFVCWLATTEFDHPAATPGRSAQYWGRGRRFGMHDIGQGRIYWWGTMNMAEERARNWDGDKAEIAEAFRGWAPETAEAIAVTPLEQIIPVPSQDRPFVERWGDGPVTLLGDAAHPMLTSLAQGGSSSIEDAVVLAVCLQANEDPVRGLREYEDTRRERARMLVDTSYDLHRVEQEENRLKTMIRSIAMRLIGRDRMMEVFSEALTMPPLPHTPVVAARL